MGFLSPQPAPPVIIEKEVPAYQPPPEPEEPAPPTPEAPTPEATKEPEWKESAREAGWIAPEGEDDTRYEDPEVDKAAKEQAALERSRKGRRSTILTGGTGLTEEADVKKKTLLGA